MKRLGWMVCCAAGVVALPRAADACLQNYQRVPQTLAQEIEAYPELADVITGKPGPATDPAPLEARLRELEGARREDDASWWAELGATHARLGRPERAIELLEPIIAKFPDDYAMHANLGTAYHMVGRLADAERAIARDLELKPDAHFGLEVFHLALLRFLQRDVAYRDLHVYVPALDDQFHLLLLHTDVTLPDDAPADDAAPDASIMEEGLRYMATMNPNEPAAIVALGVYAFSQKQSNLATSAMERAAALAPHNAVLLTQIAAGLKAHPSTRLRPKPPDYTPHIIFVAAAILLPLLVIVLLRRLRGGRPVGE